MNIFDVPEGPDIPYRPWDDEEDDDEDD